MKHGIGHETWTDGARYKGSYFEGKKNGKAKGKINFAGGSVYKKEIQMNEIQGSGVYIWPDKKKYTGDWLNNKMHG